MKTRKCTANTASVIRQYRGISVLLQLILLLFGSCAPGSDTSGPPFSVDLLPPELQKAEAPDAGSLRFIFNEAVIPGPDEITIQPRLSIKTVETENNTLNIVFDSDQLIGEPYVAEISVSDNSGNTLSFLFRFTGWNPRIPGLLINEINPRGSGNNPDCIELYTLKSGNLGGLCLKIGTVSRYSGQISFPAIEIHDGDFILIHTKSEGTSDEINEIGSLDESGGLLTSDEARDFWVPESPGLPGNNGAVTLFSREGGDVIDAVLWSDRADNREDEKLGWTSEGFIFASDLAEADAWKTGIGGIPFPSEAIDVSRSTATRSLCRKAVPGDSDTASDWHTVPTRGQTFGKENTDEVYSP